MAGDGGEVLGGDPALMDARTTTTRDYWTKLLKGPAADIDPEYQGTAAVHRAATALESIAASLAKLVEVLEQPRTDLQPVPSGAIARQLIYDKPRRPSPGEQPMPPAPKCQECGGLNGKHSPNCPLGK